MKMPLGLTRELACQNPWRPQLSSSKHKCLISPSQGVHLLVRTLNWGVWESWEWARLGGSLGLHSRSLWGGFYHDGPMRTSCWVIFSSLLSNQGERWQLNGESLGLCEEIEQVEWWVKWWLGNGGMDIGEFYAIMEIIKKIMDERASGKSGKEL